jgi:ribosome-interacting GTPase 1
VNKAIEILQTEELMLDTQYEIKLDELRLARKYGKKSEVEELSLESELIWARLSTVMKVLAKLHEEMVEA